MSGGIRKAWGLVGIGVLALVGLSLWGQEKATKKDDPALERTRKEVQILDDVYKTAIVLITENYVDEKSDLAAGAAFQKLFQAMREKGHHDVRLLDATGEPYDPDNAPRDEFEKAAIKSLKEGNAYYEQITEKNGKRYLRAATPIPVVLKKCTLCHSAYEKAKAGEPIGALGYTIEIE
ncbi:MAG TPA: DUF3365 domain-containing protein [Pirellulaceae bacterium]|jgi:hypothetical protein